VQHRIIFALAETVILTENNSLCSVLYTFRAMLTVTQLVTHLTCLFVHCCLEWCDHPYVARLLTPTVCHIGSRQSVTRIIQTMQI